jgi:hypothetical protein
LVPGFAVNADAKSMNEVRFFSGGKFKIQDPSAIDLGEKASKKCTQNDIMYRVARGYLYDQTKNPNLCKFWRALEWKILVYLKPIRPLGIFYVHLEILNYFCIFSPILVYCVKKNSGKPDYVHVMPLTSMTQSNDL